MLEQAASKGFHRGNESYDFFLAWACASRLGPKSTKHSWPQSCGGGKLCWPGCLDPVLSILTHVIARYRPCDRQGPEPQQSGGRWTLATGGRLASVAPGACPRIQREASSKCADPRSVWGTANPGAEPGSEGGGPSPEQGLNRGSDSLSRSGNQGPLPRAVGEGKDHPSPAFSSSPPLPRKEGGRGGDTPTHA